MNTRDKILRKTAKLYAVGGYESFTIRSLATQVDVAPSVIYHYFANKDELLSEMFKSVGRKLGKARAKLPETKSSGEMLKQRIEFQFDHMDEVVSVLKYFFDNRVKFKKDGNGYVPKRAYKHILEVLNRGVESGEFRDMNIDSEAKVITHGINGFLLEYFPDKLSSSERQELVDSIYNFIYRSIKK